MIALDVNNTSEATQIIQIKILNSADEELGVTGAIMEGRFFGRAEMPLILGPVEVVGGETYQLRAGALPVVDWQISYDNPYPGGEASGDPNADFNFETFVSTPQPWGADGTTTLDHTLQRSRGICTGDADLDHSANPTIEWMGLPVDTFNELGRHISVCPQRIVSGGTSPTLDDTDGDGQSDYEEFDDPTRSTRVADLPQAEISIVGDMDIRLNVEYEQSLGTEEQYGSTIGQSSTQSLSTSSSFAMTSTVEQSSTISRNVEASFPGGVSLSVTAEDTQTDSFSTETAFSATTESSNTLQSESSRFQSESATQTVASASGAIRLGMKITNSGSISYSLTNLGVTVLQWAPDAYFNPETAIARGEFKTLATLSPTLAGSFTLAPGESTSVIEVLADDLDAGLVKSFLAKPSSLYFETANFELENAEQINFAFFEENVFSRTALVVIDFGDGRVERYNVATNVDRLPDSTFAGVKLATVMGQIFDDQYKTTLNNASPPVSVLTRVRDRQTVSTTTAKAFWTVIGVEGVDLSNDSGTTLNFEDIVLHNRSSVYIVYTEDLDRDGLYAREEFTFGSSDLDSDSDDDGLDDFTEVNVGWDVNGPNLPLLSQYPKHVVADPIRKDADGDGLTDREEMLGADGILPGAAGDSRDATDPTNPDTDGDGALDGADAHPTIPARVLFVNQAVSQSGGGFAWHVAFKTLRSALLAAEVRNNDVDPVNDIAEIWIAAGVYKPVQRTDPTDPRTATFTLVDRVGVYGGFSGTENKRSQRNANPLTNSTVLSGDLDDNDSGLPIDIHHAHPSRGDNAHAVVTIPDNVTDGVTLSGFTIRSGNADNPDTGRSGGGLRMTGKATLSNLLFAFNTSSFSGAGLHSESDLTLRDCTFSSNVAELGGGLLQLTGKAQIDNCQFFDNQARTSEFVSVVLGGGAILAFNTDITINNCTFQRNITDGLYLGGAVNITAGTKATLNGCRFLENSAHNLGGGLAVMDGATVAVINSMFWNNESAVRGAGIWVVGDDSPASLSLANCTIMNNHSIGAGSGIGSELDASVTVVNSIVWGNTSASGGSNVLGNQIASFGSAPPFVTHSCVEGGIWFNGFANISQNPLVANAATGNLQLLVGSPCIDTANNLVNVEPFRAGFKGLPQTDLSANHRIVDGDGDGIEEVDMGAFEFQAAP